MDRLEALIAEIETSGLIVRGLTDLRYDRPIKIGQAEPFPRWRANLARPEIRQQAGVVELTSFGFGEGPTAYDALVAAREAME